MSHQSQHESWLTAVEGAAVDWQSMGPAPSLQGSGSGSAPTYAPAPVFASASASDYLSSIYAHSEPSSTGHADVTQQQTVNEEARGRQVEDATNTSYAVASSSSFSPSTSSSSSSSNTLDFDSEL